MSLNINLVQMIGIIRNYKLMPVCCLLIAISLCNCRGGGDNDAGEDTNLAKQEYFAEKNPVTVMTLESRNFNKELISNGRLEACNRSVIGFVSSGIIDNVVAGVGEYVEKGDVISVLDNRDAMADVENAELSFRKAEIQLIDRLLGYGYSSLADTVKIPGETLNLYKISSGYSEAKVALGTARRNLENCTLRAPFSGKVADINTKTFETASNEFCTIIDDSYMDVKFSILETEYSFVSIGQQVKVSPFNDPQTQIEGKVTNINPTVNDNGQIDVIARVVNNGRLLDGMNIKIIIENSVPDQLVVPKNAVVIRDNMNVLFRYVDGKSLWTYVNVLMSNSTEHVVEANTSRGADLNIGDLVITSGNLNLGDNTAVEIVE